MPSALPPLSPIVDDILALANEEAMRRGSSFVRPVDVLLGMLRHGRCIAAKSLKVHDLTLRRFRDIVDETIKNRGDFVVEGKLPLHPFARRAIRRAPLLRPSGSTTIVVSDELLLLAMIENPRRLLSRLLTRSGIDLSVLRNEIQRLPR